MTPGLEMDLDWFPIPLSYVFLSHKRKLPFLAIVMATSGRGRQAF